MSRRKENRKANPSPFVRKENCHERHELLTIQASRMDIALFGDSKVGVAGIVNDIGVIKKDLQIVKDNLKGRLSGKDKAAIIAAIIMALASIIVALAKQ